MTCNKAPIPSSAKPSSASTFSEIIDRQSKYTPSSVVESLLTYFQYIQPQDAHVLGQAELVIIDEAAAIPLPLVRNLMGPYLVFLASTINGYEGTGRSLSLKLIQQLRESTRPILTKDAATADEVAATSKKSTAGKHLQRFDRYERSNSKHPFVMLPVIKLRSG